MQFTKMIDNDDMIRIENENGGSVNYIVKDDVAEILSINIPEGNRRKGEGTELLTAAEAEAFIFGAKLMRADFISFLPDISEFLKSNGYEVAEGVPLLSVDIQEIFNSKVVKRVMKSRVPGAEFSTLAQLFEIEYVEVINLLKFFRLDFNLENFNHFYNEASGIVYNNSGDIKAVVLCSEQFENLHVDLLFGTINKEPQYVMAALQGMLNNLYDNGDISRFKSITLVEANKSSDLMITRALGKNRTADQIGNTVTASKILSTPDLSMEITENTVETPLTRQWQDEMKFVPFQHNIGWKMPWYRNQNKVK